MRVIIDVDDVLADLITVWVRRYNKKYHDNLKVKNITDWNIAKFTKAECGDKIYEFIESPHLYNYIKPLPYALEGVNEIRDLGFEIVYATHSTVGAAGRKYLWLKQHGFWNEKDHYVETKSKHILNGNLMIDDNYSNIEKFIANTSGFGLLMTRPWNKKYAYSSRVNGWKDILDSIGEYYKCKNLG